MMKPAAVLKIVPAFVVLAGLGTTMALAGPIEDRQAAMRFAFKNAGVDCVTVGYKNTAEIGAAMMSVMLYQRRRVDHHALRSASALI